MIQIQSDQFTNLCFFQISHLHIGLDSRSDLYIIVAPTPTPGVHAYVMATPGSAAPAISTARRTTAVNEGLFGCLLGEFMIARFTTELINWLLVG